LSAGDAKSVAGDETMDGPFEHADCEFRIAELLESILSQSAPNGADGLI
jgi:hypothetical protein